MTTHDTHKQAESTLHKGTQVISCKFNSKRRASDSQHKVDRLIEQYSRQIAYNTANAKYAKGCADRHERRKAKRKAKAESKALHS